MTVKNLTAPRPNLFRTLTRFREFGIVIFILILALIVSLRAPVFFTPRNLIQIVQQVMEVGTLAVGQTIVILTAGIDLSNGAIMDD